MNKALWDEMTQFTIDIEELVWAKDISYMEAVIMYCEEKGIELELASKLVSEPIKARIKVEAEDLHFLPKSNTTRIPIG